MRTTLPGSFAWSSPDNLTFAALCLFAFSVFFSVTVVQIALFLAIIGLLIKKHQERTLAALLPPLASHPLFVPWLLYLGVCLLTAITAYYPYKGFNQLNSDFLKFICLFTLLFSVRREHLPRLAAVYLAAAAISAAGGIAETVLSVISDADYPARAGFLMNAVRYGEAMTTALMLPLARLLSGVALPRRERLLLTGAAALIFGAIVLSQTRGAYLGVLAGCFALFLAAPAARKRLGALAVLLLAFVLLLASASPALRSRLSAMTMMNRGDYSANSPNTGINVRLELWKLGYKMFKAHPVVGVGPDNVKKVFKKFHPAPFPEEGIYGTLNNLYVHQAAERGLLGLGALLFLFLALLLFAASRYRMTANTYALWAVCALPAFYVVNITEISFQHVHTAFAVFLALAFAAAAEKETV